MIRSIVWLALATMLATSAVARDAFDLPSSPLKVEHFGQAEAKDRAAIIILSGSRGFGSPAYDHIGNRFRDAGFEVFLPHLLTPQDLKQIAAAGTARSRIAYYSERRGDWLVQLDALIAYLRTKGHTDKIGILGISLGAETAAMAITRGVNLDAVVLVDGLSQHRLSQAPLPNFPVHLIWGSADKVYPLSTAQRFAADLKSAGGAVSLTAFDGAPHDFFLKYGSVQAQKAYGDAIGFFEKTLRK